ncbi:hypothetical protein MTO96_002118 [Rhipicephalus appendiculatus]
MSSSLWPLRSRQARMIVIADSTCLSYDRVGHLLRPGQILQGFRSELSFVASFVCSKGLRRSRLSSLGDLVVAVPNYRLSLLGRAIYTVEILGIGDQLNTLRWLRDSVGLFGGHASQMVLVEDGAGAASVGHLMLARHPELACTRRYVMLSGSPYASRVMLVFGLLWPVYVSFKTINNRNGHDAVIVLKYWLSIGTYFLLDCVVEMLFDTTGHYADFVCGLRLAAFVWVLNRRGMG